MYLIDPSSPTPLDSTGRTSLCVLGGSAGGRVPTPSVWGYLHTVLGQGTGQYTSSLTRQIIAGIIIIICAGGLLIELLVKLFLVLYSAALNCMVSPFSFEALGVQETCLVLP